MRLENFQVVIHVDAQVQLFHNILHYNMYSSFLLSFLRVSKAGAQLHRPIPYLPSITCCGFSILSRATCREDRGTPSEPAAS